MTGAVYFVAVVFTVVFFGTYLLQGVILLIQIAIPVLRFAFVIAFGLAAVVIMAVWWLFDPETVEREWRKPPHPKARPPAGWARGL